MKKCLYILLAVGLCLPTTSHGADVVDSLKQALITYRRAGDVDKQIEIHYALGQAFNASTDYHLAISSLELACQLAKDVDNLEILFHIHSELGYAYYWQDRYAPSLDNMLKAKNILADDIPAPAQARFFTRFADLYVSLGNVGEATRYQLKALNKSQLAGDSIGMADAYRVMSRIQWFNHQLGEAGETLELALSYFPSEGPVRTGFSIMANLASIHIQEQALPEAMRYAKASLELAQVREYPYGIAFSTGLLGEIANHQGDYDAAENYLVSAIDMFQGQGITNEAASFSLQLAYLKSAQGAYHEAQNILYEALEMAQSIHSLDLQRDIFKELSKLHHQQGEVDLAYLWLDKHTRLQDSLFNQQAKQRMNSLGMEHEIHKRDETIAQMQARHQKSLNLVIIFSFLLIAAGMGLMFFFCNRKYRNHAQINETLKLKNREIETQNQLLKDSTNDLQYFSEVVSHDLRVGIDAINDDLAHLKEEEQVLDEPSRVALNRARRSLDYIDKMLTGIFMYSLAGIRKGPKEKIDLSEAVKEAITTLPEVYRGKGLRLTMHELPVIYAERRKIVQLFQQLINNAIKYRGEAHPEVHISCKKVICPYTGEDEFQISVKDNGIGIPKDRIPDLFQLNYHPEALSQAKPSIGLVICRKIIEQYKGAIWVESTVGEGSTFHFVLPFSQILPSPTSTKGPSVPSQEKVVA